MKPFLADAVLVRWSRLRLPVHADAQRGLGLGNEARLCLEPLREFLDGAGAWGTIQFK